MKESTKNTSLILEIALFIFGIILLASVGGSLQFSSGKPFEIKVHKEPLSVEINKERLLVRPGKSDED